MTRFQYGDRVVITSKARPWPRSGTVVEVHYNEIVDRATYTVRTDDDGLVGVIPEMLTPCTCHFYFAAFGVDRMEPGVMPYFCTAHSLSQSPGRKLIIEIWRRP